MRFKAGDVFCIKGVAVFLNGRLAHQVFAVDEAARYIDVYSLDENMCAKVDRLKSKAVVHRRYGRVNMLRRG